jgi:glycosyltransferase involved in cell wall biosynthesis
MHILHVTPYYRPAYAFGGVVRAVEGMATSLVARGHDVTVLTTDALNQTSRVSSTDAIHDGVRVIRCPNVSPALRGKLNLSTPRNMRNIAQSLMPSVDIVHIHEFRTVENLLVTPVAFEHNKPIILSPHGTLNLSTGRSTLKVWWDKLLSAGVALRIDHVLALVQSELDDVQNLWENFGQRQTPTTFSIIPNGIHAQDISPSNMPDPTKFRETHQLGTAPTVLFMGRLQARKGVDVLVKAFKQADVENARLLIVGPDEGMLETIQTLADGDPRIVMTGYLGGADRLAALAASDIFALPAVGEGLSMAMLEAMGAGLPVILSHGCNLDPHDAGFVTDVDPAQIAEKLRLLLTDDARRSKMGHAAHDLITAHYTWDKVTEQLDTLYQRFL